MSFRIHDTIWTLFPGMRLVVAATTGIDNRAANPGLERLLAETQERIRAGWAYPNAQSHPSIDAWRRAFQRLGVSGKKFPSSVEALCRRTLAGNRMAPINPLVDYYNSISLAYLVPAGGWDIDALAGGDLWLRPTAVGERFTALGELEPDCTYAGEVAYADATELITRHFVWRQSERAKISPVTSRVFLVAEVLADLPAGTAEAVREGLVTGLRDHFEVDAKSAVLEAGISCWRWE